MNTILFALLLFLYAPAENDYKILWCSGNVDAKLDLEKQLKNLKLSTEPALLNQLFESWGKKHHLINPIAVVRSGNSTFKWPSPGSKRALFYNERRCTRNAFSGESHPG